MTTDEFRNYILDKIVIARSIREDKSIQKYILENDISTDDIVYVELRKIFRQEYLEKYRHHYLDYS